MRRRAGNGDDLSEADFRAAWSGITTQLVPVTGWDRLVLNQTSDDPVALWDSFASYSGDNQTQANAIVSVADG